jgi:hypothetical protein
LAADIVTQNTAQTSEFATTGAIVIRPLTNNFAATFNNTAMNMGTGASSITFGKDGNTGGITVGQAITAGSITLKGGVVTASTAMLTNSIVPRAGPITVVATSSYTQNSTATTALDSDILITTDTVSFGSSSVAKVGLPAGANLAAQNTAAVGAIEIINFNSARAIRIGVAASGFLSLNAADLPKLQAKFLRIGSTTAGSVTFNGDIARKTDATGTTAELKTLKVLSGSTVSSTAVIDVVNLAVQATGAITLNNPHIVSKLALDSAASGSTAVVFEAKADTTYTPTTVDGVNPTFGKPTTFDMVNTPTTAAFSAFQNVNLAKSPTAKLKDSYGIALTAANTLSSRYNVSIEAAPRTDDPTKTSFCNHRSWRDIVYCSSIRFWPGGTAHSNECCAERLIGANIDHRQARHRYLQPK